MIFFKKCAQKSGHGLHRPDEGHGYGLRRLHSYAKQVDSGIVRRVITKGKTKTPAATTLFRRWSSSTAHHTTARGKHNSRRPLKEMDGGTLHRATVRGKAEASATAIAPLRNKKRHNVWPHHKRQNQGLDGHNRRLQKMRRLCGTTCCVTTKGTAEASVVTPSRRWRAAPCAVPQQGARPRPPLPFYPGYKRRHRPPG